MKKINISRLLRIVFGVLIILQAIDAKQWWLGVPGVFLLVLAALNLGCGTGSCTVPYKRNRYTSANRAAQKD